MCGICGWAATDSRKRLAPGIICNMTRALAHRGPDGEGVFEEAGIALGHRRLSILDIQAGAQPFFSASGRYIVTYNGEIYNAPLLRKRLAGMGSSFRTHCDTEVIVALADLKGFDFVEQLEGIFAFGLWDRQDKRLLLARDGLGVKPLIYRMDPDALWFASEINAIRANELLSWSVDRTALHDYLGMNSIPAPSTIWKETRRLEPGQTMVWHAGGHHRSFYWTLPESAANEAVRPAAAQLPARLDGLLQEVVGEQLQSDVPVGVFLSAGVDSAAVLHHASRVLGTAPVCFTLSWPGSSYDESAGARDTASLIGAPLEVIPFEVDLEKRLAHMAAHFGEPFGDSSSVAVWELCRVASQSVKVALSGEGGDEAFGGYETYRAHAIANGALGRYTAALARPLSAVLSLLPASDEKVTWHYKATRFVRDVGRCPAERHYLWKAINGEAAAQALYTPEWKAADPAPASALRHWARAFERFGRLGGPISTAMMSDASVYLPSDLLVKVDLSSMAHGLEVRVPLLDRRIFTLMASLPDTFKATARRTKILFRASLRDPALQRALQRPKKGFSVPASAWMKGALRSLFLDAVTSVSFRSLGAFSSEAIQRMYREHERRQCDHSRALWGLLMLALWWNSVRQNSQPQKEHQGSQCKVAQRFL